MTNEEKAIQIYNVTYDQAIKDGFPKKVAITCAIMGKMGAEIMAKWKEQQATEYLYKNIQSLLKDYGVSEASADIATQLFLANFKKAMEE